MEATERIAFQQCLNCVNETQKPTNPTLNKQNYHHRLRENEQANNTYIQ